MRTSPPRVLNIGTMRRRACLLQRLLWDGCQSHTSPLSLFSAFCVCGFLYRFPSAHVRRRFYILASLSLVIDRPRARAKFYHRSRPLNLFFASGLNSYREFGSDNGICVLPFSAVRGGR